MCLTHGSEVRRIHSAMRPVQILFAFANIWEAANRGLSQLHYNLGRILSSANRTERCENWPIITQLQDFTKNVQLQVHIVKSNAAPNERITAGACGWVAAILFL